MSISVSIPAHLVSSPWLVFSSYPTESEAVDYFSFDPHPQLRSSESLDDDEDKNDEEDVEELFRRDSPSDGQFEYYEHDGYSRFKKPQRLQLKPPSDQVWSEEEDDEEGEGEGYWSNGGSSFAGTSDRTLVDFEFDESPPTTPGGGWTYAASTETAPLPSVCDIMPEYTPFARSVNTFDDNTRSNSSTSLSSSSLSSFSTGTSDAFPLTPIQETFSVYSRTPSSSFSSSSFHPQELAMTLPPLQNKVSKLASSNTKARPRRTLSTERDISVIPVLKARWRKELIHVDTPFPA